MARDASRYTAAPDSPRVWAGLARKWLEYAAGRGVDLDRLTAALDVDRAALTDPEARVPLAVMHAIVEAALADDEPVTLALDYAGRVVPEEFDALGFLMMTSATLGQGIERLIHYQRVWVEGDRSALDIDDGRATLRYLPYGDRRPAHDVLAALTALNVVIGGSKATGAAIPVEAVRLRQAPPSPAAAAPLIEALGLEPRWRSPVDEVVMAIAALDLPLARDQEHLHAFFERHVEELAQRQAVGGSVTERVRAAIENDLHSGAPTLAELAGGLRMSRRTLQRRLADEGTSVAAILDDVRRERASALLGAGLRIAEVSYLLGYAEPSVFHRAFRRWTGCAPEQWRAGSM